ncbi:hypothetical protein [Tenacibaculum maritimum]|uniref:hypothetical protein n=1 Tax=Tenacibaculum maritimum TaxID=107401 RepID=UPI0038774585
MIPKKLIYGKSYAAVEHITDEEGKSFFSFLILQKRKNKLTLKSKGSSSSFEKVCNLLAPQKHVFLIINNQKVLSKKVMFSEKNKSSLLQKVFPNISLNDFYHQILTTDTTSFVTISRKKEIDLFIEKYQKKGIALIGISLGNLIIKNLFPFIKEKENLYTSNAKISFTSESIRDIQKITSKDQDYNINNLLISNKEILPLAGIVTYYFKQNNTTGLAEKNTTLTNAFYEKRVLNLSSYAALGTVFTALLINFLIFSNYHSKINRLTTEIHLNSGYKSKLLELKQQVEQKEKLLQNLRSVTNSKTSFYLDKIAVLIPSSIFLSKLEYHPIKNRIKKEKAIQTHDNKIKIKGIAKKSADFTILISRLEKKKWIQKVIITNYGKEKKSYHIFEILITTLNE